MTDTTTEPDWLDEILEAVERNGWNQGNLDYEPIADEKTMSKAKAHAAITARMLALGAEVIGEDVEPMMGGKKILRGQAVTIDMDNNFKESCVFIEKNGQYLLQREQRQRLAVLVTSDKDKKGSE